MDLATARTIIQCPYGHTCDQIVSALAVARREGDLTDLEIADSVESALYRGEVFDGSSDSVPCWTAAAMGAISALVAVFWLWVLGVIA